MTMNVTSFHASDAEALYQKDPKVQLILVRRETSPEDLRGMRIARGILTAFGGARGRTDVPRIVDWYMDGRIEIDSMITHTLSLDEINKGFDLMREGKSIRSVVVF